MKPISTCTCLFVFCALHLVIESQVIPDDGRLFAELTPVNVDIVQSMRSRGGWRGEAISPFTPRPRHRVLSPAGARRLEVHALTRMCSWMHFFVHAPPRRCRRRLSRRPVPGPP